MVNIKVMSSPQATKEPARVRTRAGSFVACGLDITLIFTIAHLEMGRLAERLTFAGDPVRDPVDHLPGADARIAEQPIAALCVAQMRVGTLMSLKDCGLAEPRRKLRGDAAHAQKLRPGDVERHR